MIGRRTAAVAVIIAFITLYFNSSLKSGDLELDVAADTATHVSANANITRYPEEKYVQNIKQLTFGGDNAEAYFSFNGRMISFQARNLEQHIDCDQIYYSSLVPIGGFSPTLLSSNGGRTTCSYFLPGDTTILFASTHLASKDCPPTPPRRADHKYVWPVYTSYDIFIADLKGNILKQLTNTAGYDAEATVSPKGDKIVFTSMRSGDLELYTMNIDGSDIKQITNELGYDGGAFFSPNGKKIVYRSSRPKTKEEIKTYKDLLKQGLVMPTDMEIYICDADGSHKKQITHLGGANWSPYFTPDGKHIIFSSNHKLKGFHFNLYTCNLEGDDLEQITYDTVFDAFPVFSPDGKKLIWSSNRNNNNTRDINLFIADWVK